MLALRVVRDGILEDRHWLCIDGLVSRILGPAGEVDWSASMEDGATERPKTEWKRLLYLVLVVCLLQCSRNVSIRG